MGGFGKLVRFKNNTGTIFRGEAKDLSNITKETLVGAKVPVYNYDDPWTPGFELSGRTEEIAEVCKFDLTSGQCRWQGDFLVLVHNLMASRQVLAPLANVPIFLCIGLNYKKHAEEAGVRLSCTFLQLFTEKCR
jgi:2-keto-4-pentenoate hydratase/2-oxohepta-3-ene-1,7-dioic acid hydratase in catechol pathway